MMFTFVKVVASRGAAHWSFEVVGIQIVPGSCLRLWIAVIAVFAFGHFGGSCRCCHALFHFLPRSSSCEPLVIDRASASTLDL